MTIKQYYPQWEKLTPLGSKQSPWRLFSEPPPTPFRVVAIDCCPADGFNPGEILWVNRVEQTGGSYFHISQERLPKIKPSNGWPAYRFGLLPEEEYPQEEKREQETTSRLLEFDLASILLGDED